MRLKRHPHLPTLCAEGLLLKPSCACWSSLHPEHIENDTARMCLERAVSAREGA